MSPEGISIPTPLWDKEAGGALMEHLPASAAVALIGETCESSARQAQHDRK